MDSLRSNDGHSCPCATQGAPRAGRHRDGGRAGRDRARLPRSARASRCRTAARKASAAAASRILTDGEVEMLKYSTFALQRQRERERPHPALPDARLSPTSRSSSSTTTRSCSRAPSRSRRSRGASSRIDASDPRHPPHRDRARLAHEVLGRAICRHHRHDRSGGDDYALVFHGKSAARNPKARIHHQEIPGRKVLRRARLRRASRSAPASRSTDPTAPASGARTETDP